MLTEQVQGYDMNDHELIAQTNRQVSTSDARIDLQGREMTVRGEFLTQGAGEIIVHVNFPCVFTERPLMGSGAALDTNQPIAAGNLPTSSVVVGKYDFSGIDTSTKYTGADLVVVTTGEPTQKIWIHWAFTGKAVVNPINSVTSTGDTL